MPVNMLLVEGNLDGEVLGPVLAGTPTIESGCPKGSLGPRCLDQRRNNIPNVCYLRDRDYDYEPPTVHTEPVVDRVWNGITLGWRWCRHEMENYLLDPLVVAAATGWDQADYTTALISAGKHIRNYRIARWCIGRVKRTLPPVNVIPRRPVECTGEFHLPTDLGVAATAQWARDVVSNFHALVSTVIEPAAFDQIIVDRTAELTDAAFSTTEAVLTWCSGKDLFAALGPWLQASHHLDSGNFRVLMRNWIMANPEPTVALLPEWRRMREIVRA
jgi:hypothetical protein